MSLENPPNTYSWLFTIKAVAPSLESGIDPYYGRMLHYP